MDLILEFIGVILVLVGFVVTAVFAHKGFKQWYEEYEAQNDTEDSEPKFRKVTNIS